MIENSTLHFEFQTDQPALMTPSEVLSYSNIMITSHKLREIFLRQGMSAGDRVGLIGPNSIDYVLSLYALWQGGMVAVPLSTRWPERLIERMMKKIDCTFLINLSKKKYLYKNNDIKLIQANKLIEKLPKVKNLENNTQLIFSSKQEATIIFTSGSIQEPKAAVHTFTNHYYSALGSAQNIPFTKGDNWVLSLPLFHIGGIAILFRALLGGGTVAIPVPDQKLELTLRELQGTHISLVPTQLQRLLVNPGNLVFLKKMKAILLGGGPFPDRLLEQAFKENLAIFCSYGSTEMSSQITVTARDDDLPNVLTAGRVLPYREITISPDSEILVRGRTLFKGYIAGKNIESARDEDGWFHSGDLGRLDQEGTLTIIGRKDNMFISGGENIQPEEIEDVLLQYPLISEAIVVPVNHATYGKRPVAFIRWRKREGEEPGLQDDKIQEYKAKVKNLSGQKTGSKVDLVKDWEKEIREFLEERLPKYKIPDHFFGWPAGEEAMKISRKRFVNLAKSIITTQ